MLISRKHKFIFIHIYKNAGASIREALISFCSPRWRRIFNKILKSCNLPISAIDHQPLPAHANAEEIIDYLGYSLYKSFFSFAIVRNPWDWQVSQFKYIQKTPSHHQHELIKSFKSFEEYIKWRCEYDVKYQKDYIYNMNGDLLVDYVGRFERIDNDFEQICSMIGVSAILPKINVSNTTPYQQFYNPKTKEMIQKVFDPDISLFGYSFE